MFIFALKEIREIKGRLNFFKLLINGKCEYDAFEQEIVNEGNFLSELLTIETRMHEIADLKLLPVKKFRELKQSNDTHKEYEIKTRHLRVYLFHDKNIGRIVVCGGKKGTQKADIRHFRNIKKEYFKQKI